MPYRVANIDPHSGLGRVLLSVCLVMLVSAAPRAQSVQPPHSPREEAKNGSQTRNTVQAGGAWRVELFGGWAGFGSQQGGEGLLPAPGREYLSLLGLPSREVPSWYFGDGAEFLNQMAPQQEAVTGLQFSEIAALDPVLTRPALRRRSAAKVGGRLTRVLNSRYSLEIEGAFARTAWELTDDARQSVEASRVSFAAFWNDFLQLATHEVTSVATIGTSSGRQIMATGSLIVNLPSIGLGTPYAVVGAGGAWNSGTPPTISLRGRYQFVSFSVPFDERDRVDVRFDVSSRSVVTLFGGGIQRLNQDGVGIRIDGRWHLSSDKAVTFLDADSARVLRQGDSTGGITTPTVPSLIINNRASGPTPPSTLSAQGFRDFMTLSSRWHIQFSLTAGVVFRF